MGNTMGADVRNAKRANKGEASRRTLDEWRDVQARLGEELAAYPRICSGCSCSPCQCEEHGIRGPLFAARKDYLTALERAVSAESFASRANGIPCLPAMVAETADTNAMLAREAADTAFGVFARMAAAEGMVAELDGTMRERRNMTGQKTERQKVRNTSNDFIMIPAPGAHIPGAIEAQEAEGQASLVASESLPADANRPTWRDQVKQWDDVPNASDEPT